MNLRDFGNIMPAVNRQRRVNIVGKLFTMEPYIVEKYGFRPDRLQDLERIYKGIKDTYRYDNFKKEPLPDPIYGMGIQCNEAQSHCQL